jgi:antitoxin (DNA-binding transcriptional repressor) of toxin-antitoxin stability system
VKEINIAKARDTFSDIVARVSYSGERYILKRRKRAVAAIVPMQDLQKIETADKEIRGSLLFAAGAWKDFEGLGRLVDDLYHTHKQKES